LDTKTREADILRARLERALQQQEHAAAASSRPYAADARSAPSLLLAAPSPPRPASRTVLSREPPPSYQSMYGRNVFQYAPPTQHRDQNWQQRGLLALPRLGHVASDRAPPGAYGLPPPWAPHPESPSPAKLGCRSMFAGRQFSSGDAALDPYVQLLDARVSVLFPEFSDGSAGARLRLQKDQVSGRGLSLADGYLPPPGTPLALYFGEVVLDWEAGDYVLALPSYLRNSFTWHPSVDAAGPCCTRRPTRHNAALCNHTCHGATVALRRPAALRDCPLSCVVAYPAAGLRSGTTTAAPAMATAATRWT
jgi:hypothetical protein